MVGLLTPTMAGGQGLVPDLFAEFLATEPAAAPELVQARQHFFGSENVNAITGRVNPDKVILSWFGTSSLAASLRGRVVLLDTFITLRQDRPSYVPTTLTELIALKPEAIFIGHGHFDHADTAGVIASRTGAPIVGTRGVRQFRSAGNPIWSFIASSSSIHGRTARWRRSSPRITRGQESSRC